MQIVSALFSDWTFLFTLAGSALLIYAAANRTAPPRQLLLLAVLLPALFIAGGLANHAVTRCTPRTLDSAFLRIDGGVSTAIYHWISRRPGWRLPVNLVYCGLPVFAAFVLCTSPRRMLCATVLLAASAVAPIFYWLFPATGPAHLGSAVAARNCMPSLHMTWALLLAWYSNPRIRTAAWIFAGLTAFVTLATGEHYWIDLVAAVVYSACFVALGVRLKGRFLRPADDGEGPSASWGRDGARGAERA
ncbi:MAG TPA: phosphatase PAP2 family protein [Acidobacteriaceae bacterium]|nr:phosphatase PAP2 family protein [Acidobacteriaceae bacterium]